MKKSLYSLVYVSFFGGVLTDLQTSEQVQTTMVNNSDDDRDKGGETERHNGHTRSGKTLRTFWKITFMLALSMC